MIARTKAFEILPPEAHGVSKKLVPVILQYYRCLDQSSVVSEVVSRLVIKLSLQSIGLSDFSVCETVFHFLPDGIANRMAKQTQCSAGVLKYRKDLFCVPDETYIPVKVE